MLPSALSVLAGGSNLTVCPRNTLILNPFVAKGWPTNLNLARQANLLGMLLIQGISFTLSVKDLPIRRKQQTRDIVSGRSCSLPISVPKTLPHHSSCSDMTQVVPPEMNGWPARQWTVLTQYWQWCFTWCSSKKLHNLLANPLLLQVGQVLICDLANVVIDQALYTWLAFRQMSHACACFEALLLYQSA